MGQWSGLCFHTWVPWGSKWKWKWLSRVWLFATPWTIHGILQARILEWVAFPFSRRSSQPRNPTQVSGIAGGFFTSWAIRQALNHKERNNVIAATWMDLEIIILSEVSQIKINNVYYSYVESIMLYKWTYLQIRNRLIKNKFMVTKGEMNVYGSGWDKLGPWN